MLTHCRPRVGVTTPNGCTKERSNCWCYFRGRVYSLWRLFYLTDSHWRSGCCNQCDAFVWQSVMKTLSFGCSLTPLMFSVLNFDFWLFVLRVTHHTTVGIKVMRFDQDHNHLPGTADAKMYLWRNCQKFLLLSLGTSDSSCVSFVYLQKLYHPVFCPLGSLNFICSQSSSDMT